MSLVILEGLDRTGKSSVAEHYKAQGYELIHQSAPAKGLTADLFLEEMVQLVSSAANRNIVLDRSYYGELVWPQVYGRTSLLNDEGLEALRELENSVGVTRILMHDPNLEAHWKRCVDNKEPLTLAQFNQARKLFLAVGDQYGFQRKALSDFNLLAPTQQNVEPVAADETKTVHPTARPSAERDDGNPPLTKEQIKLETANAINDVLSKRILKDKGPIYAQLEKNIRSYLNNELAKIFGTKGTDSSPTFTDEEVELLKFFCEKLKKGTR